MLIIYTPKITNRVKYTFNLVFKDLLGVDYSVTSETTVFEQYNGPKFSYAPHPLGNELFFMSRNLLFENGISDQHIHVFEWQGMKVFYAAGKQSALPFDPFACSFFLVSRYEEYLPHFRDEYDRYDVKESLAYNHQFLQKPLVNRWAEIIRQKIVMRFPDFIFPEKKFTVISTIDIDNAFAYSEKGFMRSVAGYLRALATFDMNEISQRTKVLLGMQKDPYDTYDLQLNLQKKLGFKSVYFFLLGDYGMNDKNIPVENARFQSLIKHLADYAQVGIHPSFGSNKSIDQLRKEVGRLSKIIHTDINHSRQHFLKLSLPETYRNLISLDINNDYTMGYSTQIGFRAGICSPFYFYDLDMELETQLLIYPFTLMESTLKYSLKLEGDKVLPYVKPIIDEVRAAKGTFISLWHNESMSGQRMWKGWNGVYEQVMEYAMNGSTEKPSKH